MQQPRYSPAPPPSAGIRPTPQLQRPPNFSNVSLVLDIMNYLIILYISLYIYFIFIFLELEIITGSSDMSV